MKLKELLENMNILDNDSIIFTEKKPKWLPDSEAIVSYEDEIVFGEFTYFLEVYLAKEVVEVWSKWRSGQKPNIEDICEAVIYYAEYDAYLPADL